ncbi:MAG: universal stress protein [Acidobacteriota bacterium]|nr:universal stress protein [Acidobacteriota bacterium]
MRTYYCLACPLTLLHVEAPPDDESEWNAEREAGAEKQLRDFLSAAFAHLDVKRILRVGTDVAQEIINYAREQGSDLIMMPTHGYGVFHRLLLGSVTARILHDADCPVWTGVHLAQGPPAEWISPTTILCAAGTDAESEKALGWTSRLASELDAAMVLVHVEPRLQSPGEGYYSREYHEQVMAEANRKMDELQRAAGTRAEVTIRAGSVPHAVCKTAEDLNADLLVIGRGSGAAHERMGLNTYGIICESPCPVVSV